MDLIERYLHAVKGHLPLKQQDDVVAELAEDLRSRVDERESELGRRSPRTRSWPCSGSLARRRIWPAGTDRGSS